MPSSLCRIGYLSRNQADPEHPYPCAEHVPFRYHEQRLVFVPIHPFPFLFVFVVGNLLHDLGNDSLDLRPLRLFFRNGIDEREMRPESIKNDDCDAHRKYRVLAGFLAANDYLSE